MATLPPPHVAPTTAVLHSKRYHRLHKLFKAFMDKRLEKALSRKLTGFSILAVVTLLLPYEGYIAGYTVIWLCVCAVFLGCGMLELVSLTLASDGRFL